jgi:hypothetical protein
MVQKHLGRLLGTLVVAIAAIAVFASVASAKPKPPYEQFAGCPTTQKSPVEITSCVHSTVTGGHFKIGNKEVPIEHPLTLTGGVGELTGPLFFTSEGGLSVVKQKVPGGVVGLTGLTFLFELFGSEALTLYAAAELVGTPVLEGLEALRLPIRTHLINGLLGNSCYVGSTSSPISLHMFETVQPEIKFDFATEILHVNKGVYVDKSFSAPGASGCVLTLFGFLPVNIDGLVNAASGLPAETGNEAVQNVNTELVEAELVK